MRIHELIQQAQQESIRGQSEYKVGDRVQVHSWTYLRRKYGKDTEGDIPVEGNFFLKAMKEFCGSQYIIYAIHRNEIRGVNNISYLLAAPNGDILASAWNSPRHFSASMIMSTDDINAIVEYQLSKKMQSAETSEFNEDLL